MPITADQHGDADGIVLEDEYEVHTWLSSFVARAGKLHFLYMAHHQPAREHYMRYDVASGKREVHIWPEFGGAELSLCSTDGLLATRASVPGSPIFALASAGGRIACLASQDEGATWCDHGVSAATYGPYAIGGCREVTEDGYIIGTFTDRYHEGVERESGLPVLFFRIRAQ